jgi:hypothetical protein
MDYLRANQVTAKSVAAHLQTRLINTRLINTPYNTVARLKLSAEPPQATDALTEGNSSWVRATP